jgi:hypothetical protein
VLVARRKRRATAPPSTCGAEWRTCAAWPLAFEPIGFQEPCLAAEADPFERAVHGHVAVVGMGVHAMDAMPVDQPRDHGAERLGRHAPAACWVIWRDVVGGRWAPSPSSVWKAAIGVRRRLWRKTNLSR